MTWAVKFRSNSRLGGYHEYFLRFKFGDITPALFRNRKEARSFAREKYGYIRKRRDLRREPHGWLSPQIVKVKFELWEFAP